MYRALLSFVVAVTTYDTLVAFSPLVKSIDHLLYKPGKRVYKPSGPIDKRRYYATQARRLERSTLDNSTTNEYTTTVLSRPM